MFCCSAPVPRSFMICLFLHCLALASLVPFLHWMPFLFVSFSFSFKSGAMVTYKRAESSLHFTRTPCWWNRLNEEESLAYISSGLIFCPMWEPLADDQWRNIMVICPGANIYFVHLASIPVHRKWREQNVVNLERFWSHVSSSWGVQRVHDLPSTSCPIDSPAHFLYKKKEKAKL